MSAVRQYERTYQAIRDRLMTGAWPPGHKLVTPRLAGEFDVSQSPVRDSLCHLAGEQMVDFVPSEGFFVPSLDAEALCDLLDCNLWLMHMIVTNNYAPAPPEELVQIDHAHRTAALFERVVIRSRNVALTRMVRGLNDRLHVFRRLDPQISKEAEQAIGALEEAFSLNVSKPAIRHLLVRYHISRKIAAEQYIRLRNA